MRTYLPDQWLRNWFVGGPAHVDYSCPGQLEHGATTFSDALAQAWTAVARLVAPDVTMVVRFGVLPSSGLDATELLEDTLERSGEPWHVTDVRSAGAPPHGRRQAVQFKRFTADASTEVDVEVVLN